MSCSTFDQLGEQIAADVAHLDAAHHRVLANLRLFDDGGGWLKQGFRSCAQWLSWRVGWGLGTAREHVRVAKALGRLPKIDDALRTGTLSFSKVRALTRVATPDNEHVLLEQALLTTGYQLEMICAKYASVLAHGNQGRPVDDLDRRCVQRRVRDDGMVVIQAVLHPDEAAIVWAALERQATEQCRERGDATAIANVSAETATGATGANVANTRAVSAETSTADNTRADVSAETSTADNSRADVSTETSTADNSRADVSTETSTADNTRVDVSAETAANTLVDVSAETADAKRRAMRFRASPPRPELHRKPAFDRADALVAIARAVVCGTRPDRSPTELVITLPVEALHGSTDDPASVACCRDGTALSSTTAHRLACDAGIVTIVEDKNGNALAVGRKRRTISGALKRAMLRRDRTCRFPGCNARAFLEGHHIEHWAHGGSTELSNVLAVCSFHHRFLHEYGFTIELCEDGTVVARNPYGTTVTEVAPRVLLGGLGWPTIEERNARFDITANSIATWDGTPADYVELVDAILKADARVERAASPA